MSTSATCPGCGQPLPYDAPQGRCPDCLLDMLEESEPPVAAEVQIDSLNLGDGTGAPQIFGDYELIGEIARGGMGVVYKARQISLGRTVALKMMLGGQFAAKELIQRFRGEAGAAAALRHPNIVAIYDVGVQAGQHYFSMDYVEGQNLSQFVRNHPLSPIQAARYVKLIADAIHYAHEHGVLHRDLKPSNILIDSATDQPRITDFGLAKRLDGGSSLTLSGQVLGSPNFMPPEQANPTRGKSGRQSDIYSLGGILYYLLTARPPFQNDSLEGTIHQLVNDEPVSPRLLNPAVPRDLETICAKCLEKDPESRYPNAEFLAQELDRFLKDEPIHAHPVSRFEHAWRWCRRKPALAASLLLILILILLIIIASPIAIFRINQEKRSAEKEAATRRLQLYAHEVNLAHESLRDFNLGHAQRLLARQEPLAGEPDLRGFEWRYFMGQCRSDELQRLKRLDRCVTGVQFAPNGETLAARDDAGNVYLWDSQARVEMAFFPGNAGAPHGTGAAAIRKAGIAFSPDAQRLAVGVESNIVVWSVRSRQKIADFTAHSDAVTYLAFSGDGAILASGSKDRTVKLWNMATECVATFPQPQGVCTLAYADDGALLAVACEEALVHLWDLSDLSRPRELAPIKDTTCWASGLAFAPKSHRLALARASDIQLWNLDARRDTGAYRTLRDRRGPLGVIVSIAFAPDGQTLVSCGSDQNLTLWDLSERQRDPAKFKDRDSDILSAAFSPNGQLLASGSRAGAVKLWDVAAAWPAAPAMSHGDWMYAVAFSPDGRSVASSAQSDDLKLWDIPSGKLLAQRQLFRPCHALAFSPKADLLAVSGSRKIELLQTPSFSEITNLPGNSAVFTLDGRKLVYVDADGEGIHWRNLATQEEQVWPSPGKLSGNFIAVSPDSRKIALADSDSLKVRLWDPERSNELRTLWTHADLIWNLAFSPDGQWLTSASWDGTNRLWNVTRPNEPAISLATHNVWAVAFSPDGRTLATGGEDYTIKLWHLPSLQQSGALHGHLGTITSLCFSRDGNDLASGSGDGTVRFWHAPTFEEITQQEKERK